MSFVVLADHPFSQRLLDRLQRLAGQVQARHASGRPWIIGASGGKGVIRSGAWEISLCHPKNVVIAPPTRDAGLTETGLLDVTSHAVDRGAILLAKCGDKIVCKAPLFRESAIAWMAVEGSFIISNDQLILAELNDLHVDMDVLASRLTDAAISFPFSNFSIWKGVHSPGPGEYVVLRNTTDLGIRTWWNPPVPGRSVADLSPELADSIRQAISAQISGSESISSDLSGGLDSTTLSFFAAESQATLHTFFMRSRNPSNNDWKWAERAAAEMGAEHISVEYQDMLDRAFDSEVVTIRSLPEGPGVGAISEVACPVVAQVLHATGSEVHFNGHGGDALFAQSPTVVNAFLRSSHPGRLSYWNRYCALNRLPVGARLQLFTRGPSYERELRQLSRGKFSSSPHPLIASTRWFHTPRFHPALTLQAKESVARLASRARSSGARKFSEEKVIHEIVEILYFHGSSLGRMNRTLPDGSAIRFESPFLDRAVVEHALALNVVERRAQQPPKPLLAAARPTSMSSDYFARPDKGEYSFEVYQQHEESKKRVRQLFADGSLLEEQGLISVDTLQQSTAEYSVDGTEYAHLTYLEFAEKWLRSVETHRATRVAES